MANKSRTIDEIIAGAKGRKVADFLPSPETLMQYHRWKPNLPSVIVHSVLAYHAELRAKDNADIKRWERKATAQWLVIYAALACAGFGVGVWLGS